MADFSAWQTKNLVKFCEEATQRMKDQDAEYQRLVDKHNALHINADRYLRALRVIYTWSGVAGALVPEHVRKCAGKALGMAES